MLEILERHRQGCRRCTPFVVCPFATAMLQRMAELVAPMPREAGKA